METANNTGDTVSKRGMVRYAKKTIAPDDLDDTIPMNEPEASSWSYNSFKCVPRRVDIYCDR